MRVLRVEGENGIGPYQNGVTDMCHYGYKQPDPLSDGIWDNWEHKESASASEYRYGFATRQQLLRWFNVETLKEYETKGHHVYEYFVPQAYVNKGDTHVAFKYGTEITKRKVTVH